MLKINTFYSFGTINYKWEFVLNSDYKMTANRRLYNSLRGTEIKLVTKGSTFGYNLVVNGKQKFFSIDRFKENLSILKS